MRKEHKHPILQKLEKYLKNTPKEQIDKDWSDILKKTDPALYYEKKYKEALECVQEILSSGSDAIKMSRLKLRLQPFFPELKESKDEKIKREIIDYINELADLKNEKIPTKWLDWLEKQDKHQSTDDKEKLEVLKFIRKETCCGLAEANNALLKLIKVLKEHPLPIMDKPYKLKIEWEKQQGKND